MFAPLPLSRPNGAADDSPGQAQRRPEFPPRGPAATSPIRAQT